MMTQQRTRIIKPGDWLILRRTSLEQRLTQITVRVAHAQRVNGVWTYLCTSLHREARKVTEEAVSGRATRIELTPSRTGYCEVCGAKASLTAGFRVSASHGELGWMYVGLCGEHAASVQ